MTSRDRDCGLCPAEFCGDALLELERFEAGRGAPLRSSGPSSGVVARTTVSLNSSEYIWPCLSLEDAFLLVRRWMEGLFCSCGNTAELRLDSLRLRLSILASIVFKFTSFVSISSYSNIMPSGYHSPDAISFACAVLRKTRVFCIRRKLLL